MADINSTLYSVGTGLGDLFDGIAVPLGTLIILIGIAGAIIGLLYGIPKLMGRM